MPSVNNLHRLFSPVSLLLGGLAFVLLFVGFFHPITAMTQDLGRHLLTGKLILQTHHVPAINLYSYTYPDFPFINTHWLSEVLFYLIQSTLGFTGLLVVMTLIVLATFALLFWEAKRRASITSLTVVCLLLFPVLFERTDLRPELFSFFLLAIFITVLYRNRERSTKLLYILPVLSLLWVNLHIYFLLGLGTIGLFVVEQLLRERQRLEKNRFFTLAGVFLLCILASLLNPHGLTGLLYPFNVFHNYGYTIQENQNIFFLQSLFPSLSIRFFEISTVVLFLSLSIAGKRTQLIDWFLAITFTVIGAMAIRNFPMFVIAVFVPFTSSLTITTHKLQGWLNPALKKRVALICIICLSALLLWQIDYQTSKHPLSAAVVKSSSGAAAYFLTHHLSGPIFNNFDIGSDLEYRLYPREKVFVDGRPEAYPASFFQSVYIPMQQNPALFQRVAAQYHFQTIIFSHTDQTPWAETFLAWISKDPTWKITYLDDTMIILQPATAIDQPAIKDNPSLITSSIHSLPELQQYAHFFSVVSWPQSLKATLQAILALDSHNCPSLYNLTLLLQQQNDPSSLIYGQQYQQFCR